ncbi:hypothetical protein [Gluconacetobacter takamatsuzukensis]|uniref:Uncharacterized protein n=1 Tax=Gluconacetobacter takamatsuzukensis TaxID=1286190 RepID=A0A7W4PSN1_9PROT|nr:hypothetical protein [Gluconacetobacter takamatsuzukensis]MBB2206619.1 hypothetical protein [Gluconacetobacter takamatsuzukensis]
MPHRQTSTNDLSRSERLALHAMRHFMPACPPADPSHDDTLARLPLSLLSEDYPHVAGMFARAAAQMAGGTMERPGIMPFQAPMVTATEHHLLDTVAISQNGRITDLRRALRPVFPEGDIPDHLMAALAMLGACLAGAGYHLPRRAAGGAERQWWHEPVSVADWLREVMDHEAPSPGAMLARPVDDPPVRAV